MEKAITISGIKGAMGMFADLRALLASTKPMQGIVEDGKKVILEKTAQGKDYLHRNFKPYSKPYAKKKGTPRPDLKVSGTMLDSVKATVISPNHGRISVDGTSEPGGKIGADMLAQIHNTGTGKQSQREFMNINETQMKALKKKHYDDPILEIVKRSPLRG